MIQGYFLSLVFLVLYSLMFYQTRYRMELSFMLRFSSALESSSKLFYLFTSLGFLTFLILIFFPVSPGPVILGDILPAVVILYDTLYFFVDIKRKEKNEKIVDYLDKRRLEMKLFLARLNIVIAALHFLLPSFVII